MKASTVALLTPLYVTGWLGTAGALNADMRCNVPHVLMSARDAVSVQGTTLFFGLWPPTWLAAPFLTGFYYSGWTLTRKPTTPGQCK